jgi:MFS family permease
MVRAPWTEENPMPNESVVARLRNPASAAVAGIIFSVILIVVLAQFHSAVPATPSTDWLTDPGRRQNVQTAVSLIPFAGIAFLWFIGVIRTRLGAREDKLFATVFLGSGLLFVALLFLAGALLTTVLTLYQRGIPVGADALLLLVVFSKSMMGMFGARMAAVFTISVSSIGMRTQLVPRWLVVIGYVTGVLLLLSPPLSNWTQLLFPTWVLIFSIYILIASRHLPEGD